MTRRTFVLTTITRRLFQQITCSKFEIETLESKDIVDLKLLFKFEKKIDKRPLIQSQEVNESNSLI